MTRREPRRAPCPEPDYAEVALVHNATGGCTWDVHSGNLRGLPTYAVGKPRRSAAVKSECVTVTDVRIAWDLIGRPALFGTWFDAERGWSIMEPIELCDIDAAIYRAKRRHGRAIFDLERGVVIPLAEL